MHNRTVVDEELMGGFLVDGLAAVTELNSGTEEVHSHMGQIQTVVRTAQSQPRMMIGKPDR